MSRFECGQIWLVNFDPSFGHEYRKMRPALIVQNDGYIERRGLVAVIPLSSKVDKKTALDVLIKKDGKNRLRNDSLLKVKQISSFDQRRFVRLIGSASGEVMAETERKVRELLF